MATEHDATLIAAELDATHHRAMEDFRNKDVGAYMRHFAPELRYRQMNGVEIGRDQLAQDVQAQLSRIDTAVSSYTRESLAIEGDLAIEQLVQVASATARVFVFFRRTWQVRRSGRYTWAKNQDGWKIQRVEILDERITSGAA